MRLSCHILAGHPSRQSIIKRISSLPKGFRFHTQLEQVQEATYQCFSLTLMFLSLSFLSLSLSLSLSQFNKHILGCLGEDRKKLSPLEAILPNAITALLNVLIMRELDLYMRTCKIFTCQPPYTYAHGMIYFITHLICSLVSDNQDDIGKPEEDLEPDHPYMLLSQHSPHKLKFKRQKVTSLKRKKKCWLPLLTRDLGKRYFTLLFFPVFWFLVFIFLMPPPPQKR